MVRLKPLICDSWPSEDIRFALAIKVTDRANGQLHAAALYRVDDKLMIGDVASHLWSRKQVADCSDGLLWLTLDLTTEDQRILAAKIDAWLDENCGRIPYSVAHPGGVIFKDNVWVGDKPGQGLTCATFIAELFNELGIPFIDESSWEQRSGDAEWAERILNSLSRWMAQEHVDAQRARIGETIRIRPSDIAAAGHLIHQEMESPLDFAAVDPMREAVENALL